MNDRSRERPDDPPAPPEGGAPEEEPAPRARATEAPPAMKVREDDLEPHAGLRYIARLFKVLAVLLLLLLVAEIVIGLLREGQAAVPTLLVEATRLIVFAGFLWGAGDLALMLIESNHDLRATRILVGRLNLKLQRLVERDGEPRPLPGESPPPGGGDIAAGGLPDVAPRAGGREL